MMTRSKKDKKNKEHSFSDGDKSNFSYNSCPPALSPVSEFR